MQSVIVVVTDWRTKMQKKIYRGGLWSLKRCQSHRSTAAVACGGFAAERPAGRRYRSTAGDDAQQQIPTVSCRQPSRDEAERRLAIGAVISWVYRSLKPPITCI